MERSKEKRLICETQLEFCKTELLKLESPKTEYTRKLKEALLIAEKAWSALAQSHRDTVHGDREVGSEGQRTFGSHFLNEAEEQLSALLGKQ